MYANGYRVMTGVSLMIDPRGIMSVGSGIEVEQALIMHPLGHRSPWTPQALSKWPPCPPTEQQTFQS